jgi:hypothetical protein
MGRWKGLALPPIELKSCSSHRVQLLCATGHHQVGQKKHGFANCQQGSVGENSFRVKAHKIHDVCEFSIMFEHSEHNTAGQHVTVEQPAVPALSQWRLTVSVPQATSSYRKQVIL